MRGPPDAMGPDNSMCRSPILCCPLLRVCWLPLLYIHRGLASLRWIPNRTPACCYCCFTEPSEQRVFVLAARPPYASRTRSRGAGVCDSIAGAGECGDNGIRLPLWVFWNAKGTGRVFQVPPYAVRRGDKFCCGGISGEKYLFQLMGSHTLFEVL